MKRILLLVLVLALSLPVGMTSAQNPAPGTKEDNACNAGGVMEGKCGVDPWAWVCGYYLARWQSNGGWSTINNPFNDACLSLLPPRPAPDANQTDVITICKIVGIDTICLSSDQIGTIDRGTDGTIDEIGFFTNTPVGAPPICPATFAGKPYLNNGSTINLIPTFTALELFSILGLGVNLCSYQ